MTDPTPATTTTATGLAPNVAGLLAYVLGPITGVAFLVLEKENRFVRFHAAQSIVVGIALVVLSIAFSILSTILAFIPIVGWIIAIVAGLGMSLGTLALWIVLMMQALAGREWEVPVLGAYARRLATPGTL